MKANKTQIAECFGVSPRTITNWQEQGLPVDSAKKGGRGNVYLVEDCIAWYVQRRIDEILGSEQETFDLTHERARLAHYQANLAQLDAQTRRFNLWPVEVIALALQRIIGNARSRLLSVPQKFLARVPDLSNTDAKLLELLIRESLDELGRDGLPRDLRERLERYHADLDAAAGPADEPVGT